MAKRENFNPRTRDYFEQAGWIVEKGEHYNPYSGRTTDFGGFADFIMYVPLEAISLVEAKSPHVALQVCRESDWTTRRRKIIKNGRALGWLLSGSEIWIVGWTVDFVKKPDIRGAMRLQKEYTKSIHLIELSDFKESPLLELPLVLPLQESSTQIRNLNQILLTQAGKN